MVTMCFQQSEQVFRWGLSERDQATAKKRGMLLGPVVEINQPALAGHLTDTISKDIFSMVSSLAHLDIPNHVHIILILIQIFTRDGLQMEKQVGLVFPLPCNKASHYMLQSKVDLARAYYLQLLYKYMGICHSR